MEYRSEPAKGCVLALGCGFIFWAVVLPGWPGSGGGCERPEDSPLPPEQRL